MNTLAIQLLERMMNSAKIDDPVLYRECKPEYDEVIMLHKTNKMICRTCRESLLLHNFTISNGYHRRDCKDCYNKHQRTKRSIKSEVTTVDYLALVAKTPNSESLKRIIRDLQRQVLELEEEANELNNELISFKEEYHASNNQ